MSVFIVYYLQISPILPNFLLHLGLESLEYSLASEDGDSDADGLVVTGGDDSEGLVVELDGVDIVEVAEEGEEALVSLVVQNLIL